MGATIVSMDSFPQEMGFLLEDGDLPGAWEKAHVVMAELPQSSGEGLAAGHDVDVRWRPQ
jgi:hypothetical protein